MGAVQPQRELSNQLAVAAGQLLAQNEQSMNAPRGECSEHQPRKVEDAPRWVTKPRCHGTDMTVRVARVIRDAVALTCYLRMILRWCYPLLYPGSLFILADFLRPAPSSYVCAGLAERFHCSFAYSALACFRIGMSGSASFHSVRKSSYALFALRCLLSSRRHDRFGDGLRLPTLYWQNCQADHHCCFSLAASSSF
jgi:hypothetical protein